MEIYYNQHVKDYVSRINLKNRVKLINLVLFISKFLLVNPYPIDEKDRVGQLNYDKNTKRLMLTENNIETSECRHFSLQYPFNIKCDKENYRISLQSTSNEFEIYSVHIQILQMLLDEGVLDYQKAKYGISMETHLKIEDIVKTDLDMITSDNLINEVLDIFLDLLVFEPAYIRFDEDAKRQDGDIHPLYHFDIFYSNAPSLKIGSKAKIDFEEFNRMLGKNGQSCKYLH